MDLGEVESLAGRPTEARASFDQAIALFERKGNVVGVGLARSRMADPVVT